MQITNNPLHSLAELVDPINEAYTVQGKTSYFFYLVKHIRGDYQSAIHTLRFQLVKELKQEWGGAASLLTESK